MPGQKHLELRRDYRSGPGGQGNPARLVKSLADGESAEYSVGGYGADTLKATLTLTRAEDIVTAHVESEALQQNSSAPRNRRRSSLTAECRQLARRGTIPKLSRP
ncbi:MAG: hypothetical protein AB7E80_00190 [Hyphomicrobiaceae bacterium]